MRTIEAVWALCRKWRKGADDLRRGGFEPDDLLDGIQSALSACATELEAVLRGEAEVKHED